VKAYLNHIMKKMKMNKIAIALMISLTTLVTNTYAVRAIVKGSVCSSVHEASGLDFTGGSTFWTHNDGYGDNKLYRIGSTGALKRTVRVTNATNVDWEDITSDKEKNNMYIGDFGNNNNNRTNLKIYKIPYPSNFSGSTVTARVIRFSYPDQHRFPSRWLNFDVEAFFHHNGLLYLFTKADGNAIGYSKLYTVPDDEGTYVATLVDSFRISGRVTSAAISPDGATVTLISNTKIYMFRNFTGRNVFNGHYTKISIDGGWTQKEGVTFQNNSTICLIDEGRSNKLYTVNLSPYYGSLRMESPDENEEENITKNIASQKSAPPSSLTSEGVFTQLEVFVSNSPNFCSCRYSSSVKISMPMETAISKALFFGLCSFRDLNASPS
jgi:hypothetical protein